jgi:hypothetical protein
MREAARVGGVCCDAIKDSASLYLPVHPPKRASFLTHICYFIITKYLFDMKNYTPLYVIDQRYTLSFQLTEEAGQF